VYKYSLTYFMGTCFFLTTNMYVSATRTSGDVLTYSVHRNTGNTQGHCLTVVWRSAFPKLYAAVLCYIHQTMPDNHIDMLLSSSIHIQHTCSTNNVDHTFIPKFMLYV